MVDFRHLISTLCHHINNRQSCNFQSSIKKQNHYNPLTSRKNLNQVIVKKKRVTVQPIPIRKPLMHKPIDIASLVFFRVAFGILGFADVLGVWTYYHLYKGYFDPAKFHFTYYGFEWVRPFPEPFMSLFFLMTMAAALFVLLGRWYRLFCVIFAFGFTYIFLMEKALYLNHGYLFCWISWVMVFLPANRQWSGDVLNKPAIKSGYIERWSLWILPFLMGVVYLYGGIAKLNTDWLFDASPLHGWLKYNADLPVIGWLLAKKETAYFMAWGGTLLDLSAPFLLLFRKTRTWALGFILFFHLTNTLIFQIGIFPWLSICLSLLFFPPDFPRRGFEYLRLKIRKLEKIPAWWNRFETARSTEDSNTTHRPPPAYSHKFINILLICVAAFHLLMPLRHHWFPGDVAWTEEGHRFAWRMMLRSKQGRGHFEVVNPATAASEKINPGEYLTDRQVEKVLAHPDMILQFAHYLRDKWQSEKGLAVEVYGHIRLRLNGRKATPFIDEKVDLAKEKWSFYQTSDWILPFPTEKELVE
jgi:hypothetical protein